MSHHREPWGLYFLFFYRFMQPDMKAMTSRSQVVTRIQRGFVQSPLGLVHRPWREEEREKRFKMTNRNDAKEEKVNVSSQKAEQVSKEFLGGLVGLISFVVLDVQGVV